MISASQQYLNALRDLQNDPEAKAQLENAKQLASAIERVNENVGEWQSEFHALQSHVESTLVRRIEEYRLQTNESHRIALQHAQLIRVRDIAIVVRQFDTTLASGDYVNAATASLDLKKSCASLPSTVANDVTRRCDAVSHRLDDIFVRLFCDITSDRWLVQSKVAIRADQPAAGAISASNSLVALANLDEFDHHVNRLLKRLVRTVLPRIANGASLRASDQTLHLDATDSSRSLSVSLDSTRVLIEFIRSALPSALIDVLLPRLACELVDALAPLLDFAQFTQQRDLVQQFEQNFYALGLSARLVDGEQRYVARLHATALDEARTLLFAATYPNPLETFATGAVHLDKEARVATPLNGSSPWHVTRVAQQMVQRIGSASSALLAVDLITLYSAAIRLRTPQIAAVAAQTLLLVADVQYVLRRVRAMPAPSVGAVLELRALESQADETFDAACVAQRTSIDESWATAEGLSFAHLPARQRAITRACQRIELQLTRLARALAADQVGPRNAVAQLMARSLRHACDLVSGGVLALANIGASECTALQTILTPLVAALEALGDVGKLRAVVSVLPMSIVELHAALPMLRKSLDTAALQHLICAMFQESDKRKKLLATL